MSTVIMAYVPVLHTGYLKFFEEYEGNIILIDPSIVPEVAYLPRDMRALPTEITAKLLRSLFGGKTSGRVIRVAVTRSFLLRMNRSTAKIIMPDEDVSREVHKKYFPGKKVDFVPVFLRWHWNNVKKSVDISPDRKVTHEALYQELMGQARLISQRSSDWWRQVGALLVRDEEVLITGYNRHFPTEHSPCIVGDPRTVFNPGESIEMSSAHHGEKEVITYAARKGIVTEGAYLLVTTFPCPGCAMDIASAGISRVYYSEGYSLVDAEGILRSRGVEIIQVV